MRKDPFKILLPQFTGLWRVGPEFKVFLNRHVREQEPAFGDLNDPDSDPLVRRKVFDALPFKGDGSGSLMKDPGDGVDQGRFTGCIGAYNRRQFSCLHIDLDGGEGLKVSVIDIKILRFEQGHILFPDRP